MFHWKVREADAPVIFLESVIKERRQEVFFDRVRHFLEIPANAFDNSLHEFPPLLQRLLNGRVGRLWNLLGDVGELLHGQCFLQVFQKKTAMAKMTKTMKSFSG